MLAFSREMKIKEIKWSVAMSIGLAIFLPIAESIRRFNQIIALEHIWDWADDYVLALVLLIAALSVKYKLPYSVLILGGVFSLGLLVHLHSTYTQLIHYLNGDPDPGILASGFVLIVKLILLVYILIACDLLIKGALRLNDNERGFDTSG